MNKIMGKRLEQLENGVIDLGVTVSQLKESLCGNKKATNKELLTAVEQLKSRLAQEEVERDAAVRDMFALAINYESDFVCDFCGGNSPLLCEQCKIDYCGFKWRGVCAENSKEENVDD